MFPILWARQRRTGMSGWTRGQGGGEAVAAVGADHFEAFAGEAVPVEGAEQAFPFGCTFAAGELEVDDLLAPVGEDAEGHRDRPPDGADAGFACEHHVVGHEGLAAVGEGAAVEGGDGGDGGDGGVQCPGDAVDGRGRDRSPEQGQEDPPPTLRVDRPGTKPARMTRSISPARCA